MRIFIINNFGIAVFKAESNTPIGLHGYFGSYARQAACDSSDIDLMVELEDEKKTLRNFFSLKRYLEKSLGKKVDLGIESTLKPVVKEAVQKDVIYV
ncbi:hypothetical protein JCM39068_39380 [Desulfocastanea catecholica]